MVGEHSGQFVLFDWDIGRLCLRHRVLERGSPTHSAAEKKKGRPAPEIVPLNQGQAELLALLVLAQKSFVPAFEQSAIRMFELDLSMTVARRAMGGLLIYDESLRACFATLPDVVKQYCITDGNYLQLRIPGYFQPKQFDFGVRLQDNNDNRQGILSIRRKPISLPSAGASCAGAILNMTITDATLRIFNGKNRDTATFKQAWADATDGISGKKCKQRINDLGLFALFKEANKEWCIQIEESINDV